LEEYRKKQGRMAEASEEGLGSKWAVVPMIVVVVVGHVMYQEFNIQQLYALPTLYLCVLYLSENKQ